MSAEAPTLLTIRHVPWEEPHRILGSCGGLAVRSIDPLAGDPLPPHAEVSGAVVMGARSLASSAQTGHQAFRVGSAWGLLFHAEADAALLDRWLSEPEMRSEATDALGPEAVEALPGQAREAEPQLIARSTPGFDNFTRLVATFRPT